MVREILSKFNLILFLLDVCRIRLDYDAFTLTVPSTVQASQGQCLNEFMTVRYRKVVVVQLIVLDDDHRQNNCSNGSNLW